MTTRRYLGPLPGQTRRRLKGIMRRERLSEVQLALLLGIGRSTLRRALQGRQIAPQTVDVLSAWVDARRLPAPFSGRPGRPSAGV